MLFQNLVGKKVEKAEVNQDKTMLFLLVDGRWQTITAESFNGYSSFDEIWNLCSLRNVTVLRIQKCEIEHKKVGNVQEQRITVNITTNKGCTTLIFLNKSKDNGHGWFCFSENFCN